MSDRSIRGKVAVVGVGETRYYKRGQSPDPEFVLGLKAILAACEDAGIDPREIDGFASYSNDRNDPSRFAAARGSAGCAGSERVESTRGLTMLQTSQARIVRVRAA